MFSMYMEVEICHIRKCPETDLNGFPENRFFMERRRSFVAVLLALLLVILLALQTPLSGDDLDEDSVNASFYNEGEKVSWAVLEVAENETERRKGLMNRTELGKRQGMLFVFEEEEMRAFWMKNTYIPLDIIFINENRTVINVEKAVPQPDASDQNLKRYRSDRPAKYVIEVNAGYAENYSIKEGSKASWRP